MLKEGNTAPEFNLVGDDNQSYSLNALKNKNIVLYFYPKDDTPGCTREACGFRDNMQRLANHNTVVFGVSKDNTTSHNRFKTKYDLNFTLLSDPDLVTHQRYNALKEGKTHRSTFIIDKKGKIAKMWMPVKVNGHVEEVLKFLAAMEK